MPVRERRVVRPTRRAHDGAVKNGCSFDDVYNKLSPCGRVPFLTKAGTPFEAKAHAATKGPRRGQRCIRITRGGKARAYIYKCCWDHVTNCTRTYIDIYTEVLCCGKGKSLGEISDGT
jgi:hypothetical protein